MKKILLALLCSLFIISCKKDKTIHTIFEKNATSNKTALKVLNQHAKNAQDFQTTIIRSTASYQADKDSKKFSLDILIQKDQSILLDIRFISFPVARALITPDNVAYYDKINKEYFEGDFEVLSDLLGTDISFNRLQNILLGQVLDSQSQSGDMESVIDQGLHKITAIDKKEPVQSTYYFEDNNALLKKEEIIEPVKQRSVVITYPSYQKIGKYTAPSQINILAEQEKSINLNLRYDKISFNEQINLPYSVPKGYKRVTIN
ncbi:DUF4292 domain-containing protein [Myroides sp. LJL119]